MGDECPVRMALRVDDVGAAATAYQGFGFTPVGAVPGLGGVVMMAILRLGPLELLVDALAGLPFPDSARERRTTTGPRGLGFVIGVEVADVDEAARRYSALSCGSRAEPFDVR